MPKTFKSNRKNKSTKKIIRRSKNKNSHKKPTTLQRKTIQKGGHPSNSIYYHFTCSDRRDSIWERGLCGNSPPMLNAEDEDNTTPKNQDIFFVRYPIGKSKQCTIDRDKAEFVMCFVKGTCEQDKRTEMDIWQYEDTDNLIKPHDKADLRGEYRMSRPEESRIVHNWSTQLACVRVPPEKLKMIHPNQLPTELYNHYLYSEACNET
jgi:hypothetical protein